MELLTILLLLIHHSPLISSLECATGVWGSQNPSSLTKRTIPNEWINDGYCDCPLDGSDEPNTDACAGATVGGWSGVITDPGSESTPHYACPHQPTLLLPPSHLSDTICDCCDGSDEPPQTCPDDCTTILAEERRLKAERQEKFNTGFLQRRKVMQDFEEETQRVEEELNIMDMEVPALEEQLGAIESTIVQERKWWVQERRRILSSKHKKWGFLQLVSVEDMKRLVVGVCQLVGEYSTSSDAGGCVPLRLGGYDMGWYWDESGEFRGVDSEETEREGMDVLERAVLKRESVRVTSSAGAKTETTAVGSNRAEDFDFDGADDDDDDVDHEEDYDYHGDGHDNGDYFEEEEEEDHHDAESDLAEQRRRRFERASERREQIKKEREEILEDERNIENSNNGEMIVEEVVVEDYTILSRKAFKEYATTMISKIDELLKTDDGDNHYEEEEDESDDAEFDEDEMIEEEDIFREDEDIFGENDPEYNNDETNNVQDETTTENSPQNNIDPLAIQNVRSTLQHRLDQIIRGETYAKDASHAFSSVLKKSHAHPSLEDIINLVVATIYHSQLTSPDIAELLFTIFTTKNDYVGEEFQMGDVCSFGGEGAMTNCDPPAVTRHNRPIVPERLREAYIKRCQSRITAAATNAAVTCPSPDVDDGIPSTPPPDGFLGYYETSPPIPMELEPYENNNIDFLYENFAEELYILDTNVKFPQKESDLEKIRSDLNDLRRKKDELSQSINSSSNGPRGELYRLKDTCHTYDTHQYTYSVCFFGEAHQRDRGKTSGGTSLGRWKNVSWGGDESDGDDEEVELRLHWDGGQKCWNGPKRSVTVTVTCGESVKIVSAEEPEICRYLLEMESYLGCDEEYARRMGLDVPQ